MLHYEMELMGGYLLTKMILYRYYCQYKKEHYGIVNSSIFYGHYIYRYQKDHVIAFLYALKSHLVQEKLLLFNVFLQRRRTSEVGPGFN